MFNNIEDNKRQLGLAERTQPSATEIYTQTNIPTGSVMSNYTQTQTAPQIFNVRTSQEGPFKELRSKIIAQLYEQDDENLRDYFACMQEEYAAEIDVFITDLKRWRIEIRARKRHYPKWEDYEEKRMELCKFLYVKAHGYPFDQYFSDGVDDTADAGAYLITLIRSAFKEKEERYAVVLLSGIQWLIRERDALSVDIPVEPEVETSASNQAEQQELERKDSIEIELDVEKLALKNAFTTACGLKDDEGKVKYKIGEIYHVLRFLSEGKKWAKNARTFAQYMEPVVDKTPASIQMAINREKETFENLPLNDMQSYIAQFKKDNPYKSTQELEKIAELYDTMKLQLIQGGVI